MEIGLDRDSITLPWKERAELFTSRIDECLCALENVAPGIREKLEALPARPFAYTGLLTADEIRAIWDLSALRLLSERGVSDEPTPDETGRLPFAVDVLNHVQAEASPVIEVEQLTVLVRASDYEEAKRIAIQECSTLPGHFMSSDYRIHRRWWTAEHAHLNTLYNEELPSYGTSIVVERTIKPKLKDQAEWQPDASIERVTYGSPKQRPKTWEWMIS